MFVILYQPSEEIVQVSKSEDGITMTGKWHVDTDSDGRVSTIDDLETALNRVKYIREHRGEACLAAILE
jgi:hypothetical protein